MSNADTLRSISLTRNEDGSFTATNSKGATLRMLGEEGTFTPVELLLAAIAGCSGVDVDIFTSRRAVPTKFDVVCSGDKTRDEQGRSKMENIEVRFDVEFPEGPDGDKARQILTKTITDSRDRLCTVSLTCQLPTQVTYFEGDTQL